MGGGRARHWKASQDEHFQVGQGIEGTKWGFGWLESKGLFWSGGRETEPICYLLFSKGGNLAPHFTSSKQSHLRQFSQCQDCRKKASCYKRAIFTNELTICKINPHTNIFAVLTWHLSICFSLRGCKHLTLNCKYNAL